MKTGVLKLVSVLAAICIFFSGSSYTAVRASLSDSSSGEEATDSVNRLDITSGKIGGERAEYTITVPPRWAAFLVADREHVEDENILEKINFYFEPTDKVTEQVFLASVYVQNVGSTSAVRNSVKIYETNMYKFSMVGATSNPLTSIADKGIFQQFLQDLENLDMLSDFFSTPNDQWEVTYNVIKVKGQKLKNKSIVHDAGLIYLPVREICEALGYTVLWYDNEKMASVEREQNFEVIVANDMLSERQNFKAYLENDLCYASVMFFNRNLKLNCEIDENNNVILSE